LLSGQTRHSQVHARSKVTDLSTAHPQRLHYGNRIHWRLPSFETPAKFGATQKNLRPALTSPHCPRKHPPQTQTSPHIILLAYPATQRAKFPPPFSIHVARFGPMLCQTREPPALNSAFSSTQFPTRKCPRTPCWSKSTVCNSLRLPLHNNVASSRPHSPLQICNSTQDREKR